MNPWRAAPFVLAALVLVVSCTGGRAESSDAGVADAGADAPIDAAPCPSGTIDFRFVATSVGAFCLGAPGTCTTAWLSVRPHAGAEIVIDRPCVSDCSSCELTGCPPVCAMATRLPAGGAARLWDGTYWDVRTCGAGTSCAERACATPGTYVARMCAHLDNGGSAPAGLCDPVTAATCTEATFAWPPETGYAQITGVIEGRGPARCCPATWTMHACVAADGGAPGLQCHDPALGCPSSEVCGEGCDFAVAGRCGD